MNERVKESMKERKCFIIKASQISQCGDDNGGAGKISKKINK